MRSSITFRPLARQDVLEQMLYLEEQANEETATRYYDAVFATCRLLAEQPLSGRSLETQNDKLKGLRRFPVSGAFQKHLVFYRSNEAGIEIIRILHGFRDIESVLSQD